MVVITKLPGTRPLKPEPLLRERSESARHRINAIKALRSLDVCLSGMQLRKDLAGGVASGESSFEEAAKPFPALLIEITGQAAV
jgi:hypothetical protein